MSLGYYQTVEWKKLAKACKQRDNYTCVRCRKQPPEVNLQAHHVIARINGEPNTLDNVRTLCNSCHRIIHYDSNKLDGWPEPIALNINWPFVYEVQEMMRLGCLEASLV